jgi:Xaa-Pro aminopeptidase
MLILFSTEPRVYANDVNYPYRQENNLYYLTNLNQPNATLVLLPGNQQFSEILFLPRRNPAGEAWSGHMYSAEEASRLSGVRDIWAANEFAPFMSALANRQPYRPKAEQVLLGSAGSIEWTNDHGFQPLFAAASSNAAEIYLLVPGEKESREYKSEQKFASEWAKSANGYSIRSATGIFAGMRMRKSPMELRLLQHAIDITTEAQQRAWLAAAASKWEYEVDAQILYTFKLRNADNWGYPSIVGCGPNATTLHYIESQGPVKPGDLLLLDVGAEYGHYTADVTRTVPVSGKFTAAQAEIYQIVFDAQEAAARATRPGALISDVNRAATEVIKDGLLRLGLITNKDSFQYSIWFMHSTSHWLGMNVHDVGNYGAKLEPGMVFTNEPGIYIRPDALDYQRFGANTEEWEKFKTAVRPAFEKYRGMGVRIEDDMLVTADGPRWLTSALPRRMEEIEAFLSSARK